MLCCLFALSLSSAFPDWLHGPRFAVHQDGGDSWTQAELEAQSEKVMRQLEELRGVKFLKPVPVRLADKVGFIEYAKKRSALTETPEKILGDEWIAKLLGVIGPDVDLMATAMELLEEQVGGFYDPADGSFCLMEGLPKELGPIILAHELDHALDDQLYGLDDDMLRLAQHTDGLLAFQSVCEGAGTAMMTVWAMKHGDLGSMTEMGEFQDEQMESIARAPAWIWKPLLAVYLQGAAFLARTESVLSGQMSVVSLQPKAFHADLTRAFTTPPASMEQVLHPEKYWDAAKADAPSLVSFELEKLPEGWTVLREDTLGEFLIAMILEPLKDRKPFEPDDAMAILSLRMTSRAAEGWDGDRVILLGNGKGKFLRWVTCWDSAKDAAEFKDALTALTAHLTEQSRKLSGGQGEPTWNLEWDAGVTQVVFDLSSGPVESDTRKLQSTLRFKVEAH